MRAARGLEVKKMAVKDVQITVVLNSFQAEELAYFLKRLTWGEVHQVVTGLVRADVVFRVLQLFQNALKECAYVAR